MSKLRTEKSNITLVVSDNKEVQVHSLEQNKLNDVKEFKFSSFNLRPKDSYQGFKEKYGALALTDPERVFKSKKDRRFVVNDLIREPLSIVEEEEKNILERVEKRVRDLSEKIKTESNSVGFKEGWENGKQQAMLEMKRDYSERLKNLDQLIFDLDRSKEEILKLNENIIISMVFKISKMLLLKDLSVDDRYVYRLVKTLIDKFESKNNIIIKIGKNEAQTIESLKGSLENIFGPLRNLKIETSEHLSAGGCEIETDWNAIDASIETQLKGVQNELLPKQGDSF